jgi:hypothetical protein
MARVTVNKGVPALAVVALTAGVVGFLVSARPPHSTPPTVTPPTSVQVISVPRILPSGPGMEFTIQRGGTPLPGLQYAIAPPPGG